MKEALIETKDPIHFDNLDGLRKEIHKIIDNRLIWMAIIMQSFGMGKKTLLKFLSRDYFIIYCNLNLRHKSNAASYFLDEYDNFYSMEETNLFQRFYLYFIHFFVKSTQSDKTSHMDFLVQSFQTDGLKRDLEEIKNNSKHFVEEKFQKIRTQLDNLPRVIFVFDDINSIFDLKFVGNQREKSTYHILLEAFKKFSKNGFLFFLNSDFNLLGFYENSFDEISQAKIIYQIASIDLFFKNKSNQKSIIDYLSLYVRKLLRSL